MPDEKAGKRLSAHPPTSAISGTGTLFPAYFCRNGDASRSNPPATARKAAGKTTPKRPRGASNSIAL